MSVSHTCAMLMPSRLFEISDFVRAWLSGREYRDAHVDLKSYHEAVLAAFSKAFGFDLNTPPDYKGGLPDEDSLHGLFLQVARAYECTHSPFSSYLCGTKEISAMYQKYGEPLEESANSLRALHLRMMKELVSQIWDVEESRLISQQDLEAAGHPGWDAPDSIDYW